MKAVLRRLEFEVRGSVGGQLEREEIGEAERRNNSRVKVEGLTLNVEPRTLNVEGKGAKQGVSRAQGAKGEA